MSPRDLIELVRDHTVYIQTHNCPDPDAIASGFALQRLLEHFGIRSTICYDGRVERLSATKMLSVFGIQMQCRDEFTPYMKEEDYIILVDSQKDNANLSALIGDEVACIDHHPVFIPRVYHYSDIRMVGACASILASYYKELNIPIPREVAGALAYAIKMDTAEFTRGVTALDTEMFAWLFPQSDWESVSEMYRNTMEFSDLQAYGSAIQSIEVFDRVGFAYIDFTCPPALVAIISDFILALDVVDVAVVYAAHNGGIRLSVRSEIPEVNAGELVYKALQGIGDGGGHPSMAGGYIPEQSVRENEDKIHYLLYSRFMDLIIPAMKREQ